MVWSRIIAISMNICDDSTPGGGSTMGVPLEIFLIFLFRVSRCKKVRFAKEDWKAGASLPYLRTDLSNLSGIYLRGLRFFVVKDLSEFLFFRSSCSLVNIRKRSHREIVRPAPCRLKFRLKCASRGGIGRLGPAFPTYLRDLLFFVVNPSDLWLDSGRNTSDGHLQNEWLYSLRHKHLIFPQEARFDNFLKRLDSLLVCHWRRRINGGSIKHRKVEVGIHSG